jgi:vancomycin resistance protein YoaR
MSAIHRTVTSLAGLVVLAAGLAGLGLGYESWCAERIYPGVQVWDVSVGGMRVEEATTFLEEQISSGDHLRLTLRGPDGSWGVRFADLGASLAAEATARAALEVGRGPGEGLLTHLGLLVSGQNLPPVISFDESAARRYLRALAEEINRPPVDAALTWEEGTAATIQPRSGAQLDVQASLSMVHEALDSHQPATLVVHELPPQVTDAERARAHLEGLLSQPFMLALSAPQEGDPGPWFISPSDLFPMLTLRATDGRLEVTLDEAQGQGYLESLAAYLAIAPLDARFHFDETSGQLVAITSSAEGRALDVRTSLENLRTAVETGHRVAALALQAVPPSYPATATAEETGIRELVAEGDSYFIGSPSGRDNNIRLAATRFDGIVVPPGGTFSFNDYLGEVSAEAGYDESYITAGEQLAVEVGGGICQVSTTAFRAALWGGYPIVERWYHHHRVGYYELRGYGPGFDATVYSPLVDLQFTNDRPTPLLIETEIEEDSHRLIFRFYSTDDGRRVEVSEPLISDETEPGPPIYELDEELEPGTVIEWQTAGNGLTATVERRVSDTEGTLMAQDTFVSRYAARRAAYHYGPGYEPPAAPAVEPAGGQ